MDVNGDAVTLTLSETPLPPGPLDDPPATFKGTLQGNNITASQTGVMGGMSCPTDAGPTPQVGGDLKATISGNQITGQFSAIYGTGPGQVTFVFSFQATL